MESLNQGRIAAAASILIGIGLGFFSYDSRLILWPALVLATTLVWLGRRERNINWYGGGAVAVSAVLGLCSGELMVRVNEVRIASVLRALNGYCLDVGHCPDR